MILTQTVASDPGFGLVQALILGVIEGVTEFLPISSTAHLMLAERAMRLAETEFLKSFTIIIQLGAILSVVVLYWTKLWNVEMIKKLIVAFIPTAIIGFTVYKAVKAYLLTNVPVALAALVIGGIILILFEKFHKQNDEPTDFSQITYGRALLIGVFQAIAVIPGVSRSAATILGGTVIGINKRTIVEFSFMLAVPTMLGASVLDLAKSHEALAGNYAVLAVGFVVSFITAIIAIKSFLNFIKKRDFAAFGWYRIVLAVAYYFGVAR